VPPIDLNDYEIDYFEERAAIMEFDANMTRREAEQRAYQEVLRKRRLI
jgi:hypothetical protein